MLALRSLINGGVFTQHCKPAQDRLSGAAALITGCTVGGLGVEAAVDMLKAGCSLCIITCRSEAKAAEAVEHILIRAPLAPNVRLVPLVLDLSSMASVRAAAERVLAITPHLHILVLNAGLAVPLGGPSVSTEEMWAANHVAQWLLTEELRPALCEAARRRTEAPVGCRIVAVSSEEHAQSVIAYDDPWASDNPYGQSKLAQIMHMRELQRRMRQEPGLAGEGADAVVRCLAVTPGLALTNIFRKNLVGWYALWWPLAWLVGRSASDGAQVIKHAWADDAVAGGDYLLNCRPRVATGKDGCAGDPSAWLKLWELSAKCAAEAVDGRFP